MTTDASREYREESGIANLSVQSVATGLDNMAASPEFRTQCFGVRCVFASLSAHCNADYQKRREDVLALLKLRKNQQYYLPFSSAI